jgi:microsomal dipeptidase-like Zn-dependent dipeptidase
LAISQIPANSNMVRSKVFCRLTSFIPLILFSLHPCQSFGNIDLHAHLFMDEGMGWTFNGKFDGPLEASSWKDKFSSQANPQTLSESQLQVVVATLYAHPLFTRSLRNSIRKQIDQANQFVKNNPQWILATDPKMAFSGLQNGKKILILALEGASGILETEEDLNEFIDQKGIRIVTLLHLTDDLLGGVAFLKGMRILASPLAFIKSLFVPEHDSQGVKLNPNGLTPRGLKLAEELIRRKVWIDLSHSSDHSQSDLLPLLKEKKQPLLYTHTPLRRYLEAERGISDAQLQEVAKQGGFVGLIPSEEMLEGTPPLTPCLGGVNLLATQFRDAAQIIGQSSLAIGSDINGGITHLSPSCKTGTSLDTEGFWNLGQSGELWKALKNLGAYHPKQLGQSEQPSQQDSPAYLFIQTWMKAGSAQSS